MSGFMPWIVGTVIALHGAIHVLGFTSYLKLADVAGLPYKTTVLGTRVELGAAGTSVFGVAWGVAAVGFILAALALLVGWEAWRTALIAVTLLSLLVTILDVGPANAGIAVNLALLAWLLLGRGTLPGR